MMLHSLCGKSSFFVVVVVVAKNIEIYVYSIIAHDMQKIKVLNEQKSLLYIFSINV